MILLVSFLFFYLLFHYVCFTLLYNRTPHSISPFFRNLCELRVLRCTPFVVIKSFSSTISNQNQLKETSYTVSYLINSCGLSPEDANSVSKKVHFETLERPDSVLAFLNKHGFKDSQITRIVKLRPQLLLADPDKTILPKIEFFSSIGITGKNLAELISSKPRVLHRSLNNQIIPLYKFLESVFPSDDSMLIKAMSNALRFYLTDVTTISANLSVLREVGMPQSVIQHSVMHLIKSLCYKVYIFRNKVEEIVDMGFCPTNTQFVEALYVVLSLSESNWQQIIEVYKRWGWSKDEILFAFKKNPLCMRFSEKKIVDGMNFLVNVMDFKPSAIAESPHVLSYSLKKRIIPRGLVVKILMSKGVWDHNIGLYSAVKITDKCFLERYVEKHKEQIPYLVDVLEGRISPQQVGFQWRQ